MSVSVLVIVVSALVFTFSANSMQTSTEELRGDCEGDGECKVRCATCNTDLVGIGAITGLSKTGNPSNLHGDCSVCGAEWVNGN